MPIILLDTLSVEASTGEKGGEKGGLLESLSTLPMTAQTDLLSASEAAEACGCLLQVRRRILRPNACRI